VTSGTVDPETLPGRGIEGTAHWGGRKQIEFSREKKMQKKKNNKKKKKSKTPQN
jgi:hypothetical protein